MSLLDKASLIVTPNAYKTSKLYSVVPNTTLGDMDVVRATTATRVNSAGLIEVVPRNLFTYSEQFENANWLKQLGSSIVSNTTIAPNGTLTADTLNILPSQYFFQNISAIASTTYRISIYVKVASGTKQFKFNTYSGTGNDFTSSVFTATTEWQRFTYSFTAVSNATTGIYPILVDGLVGGSFFIYGAQLDNGSTATEYFPTTTRLNIPRIDYTNGSCPSLLVEPQRTNLALRSEEFSNATWEKGTPITLVSNTTETTSPFGINNATKATANGTGLIHIRQTAYSATTSPTTSSIFVKKANNRYVGFRNGGAGTLHDVFDFNTETWTNNSGSTLSFDKLINGWYRLKSSRTNTLSNTYLSIIIPDNTSGNETATVSNLTLYIFGAQAELNVLYATSYIPTIASTVTRNADIISKTGISSLIGQTEGTIFFEADIQKRNASDFYIAISNGFSLAESIYLNQPSSGNLNVLFRTGVLTPTIVVLSANWNIGNNKIAIAYNSTLGEVFINGVSKGTVALTGIPTCNQIILGSRPDSPGGLIGAGPYKQAILFKTRLTNTELQSLTTL